MSVSRSAREVDEAYLRRERPVKLSEAVLPQGVDRVQHPRRLVEQVVDVDGLAPRCKRAQVGRPARQHVHGTVVIVSLNVVHGDADLENALVEAPDVAWLRSPEVLQDLVLLEELATVELLDTL